MYFDNLCRMMVDTAKKHEKCQNRPKVRSGNCQHKILKIKNTQLITRILAKFKETRPISLQSATIAQNAAEIQNRAATDVKK